jgi:hypothetical protein
MPKSEKEFQKCLFIIPPPQKNAHRQSRLRALSLHVMMKRKNLKERIRSVAKF